MRVRLWWQEILLATIAIFAVVITCLLIISSLRLHKTDLQWQLQKSEFLESNLSKMYMLARFVDQYKLYQEVLTHQDADEHEYAINSLFDTKPHIVWGDGSAQDIIDFLSLQIINGLRSASGKPPLANPIEAQNLATLEQAFFLERSHEYNESLRLLESLGESTKDARILGIIDLHKGFCQALSGEVEIARRSYERVITHHRDDDLGVTAALLLSHLEVILQERALLLRANLDDLTRARKMTTLWQCREVLSSFDPASVQSPQAKAEFLMLRARCLEETGDRSNAVLNYAKAISAAGNSDVARDANRRLYLLGSRIKDGARIQKAAIHMNEILNDSSLAHMQQIHVATQSSTHFIEVKTLENDAMQQVENVAQSMETPSKIPAKTKGEENTKPRTTPTVSKPSLEFPPIGSMVRVELQSGKSFIGHLLSEPSDNDVRIQAMIGVITVKRSEIISLVNQ